jgi:hypothetical protein
MLLVAVIDQRVEAGGAFNDDIAAASAVAAVRAAKFDELSRAGTTGSRRRRRPSECKLWPDREIS